MRYLRKAEIADMDMVFAWSNDPVTRAMSFNTAPIPYEDHVKWYRRLMEEMAGPEADRRLMIMMDGEEPVGQIRFDAVPHDGQDAGESGSEPCRTIVLSYSIAPDRRGLGLGSELIRLALCYMAVNAHEDFFRDAGSVKAEVKPENAGSAGVLEHNGFTMTDTGGANPEEDTKNAGAYLFSRPFPKTLYIRADMNSTIATGHIMRCLAIADAAAAEGMGVVFITADEEPVRTLKERGYDTLVLESDWRDPESELPALERLIKERRAEHLLVDSYQVTESYLQALEKLTDLSYLDDLNAFRYPVDHLIVYADYYRKWDLYEKYADGIRTDLILGTEYVPLRPEYTGLPDKRISERIEKILVLSGGGDSLHMLKNILGTLENKYQSRAAYSDRSVEVTAVCGRFNPDRDELVKKYNGPSDHAGNGISVKVIDPVPILLPLLQDADVVITAGGTTLYEICACGTPAVTYSFADNQLDNVLQFEADDLMRYAGDMRSAGSEKIAELLDEYEDRKLRSGYSQRMRAVVDGHGAQRIVQKIMK